MRILVSMPKGVIRDSFITSSEKKLLEDMGEVVWNTSDKQFSEEELKEKLKDTDIIITGWGHLKLTSEILKCASKLRLILHTGGTVGPIIDESVYKYTNVKVSSGNAYYAESVAEGVLAYMLSALRKLDFYSGKLKQGIWLDGEDIKTEGLLDQTVGIISMGNISKRLIQMANPFRIKFKVFSTSPDMELAEKLGFTYADMNEIFSTCKIVSVHTASVPDTVHFVNGNHFRLMRDGAIFINTSRGPVINDEDLLEELNKGRISAVLDVYDKEPLPQDSPYLKLENVTLYPHIAGPTTDRKHQITEFLIEDAKEFFKSGKLENEITHHMALRMTQTG